VEEGKYIVLYDGVCVMCNNGLLTLSKYDARDLFRFAPLQSRFAQEVLQRHGRDALDLDSSYVVIGYGTPRERVLWKFEANRFVISQLGLGGRVLGKLLGLVPTSLGDRGYDRIARNRYERTGKYDTCPVPPPEVRRRLLTLT
jgi:predicted DCC family thiol-disulfide oxidoreductase YuxK